MKKLVTLVMFLLLVTSVTQVLAQTKTPTRTPTPAAEDEEETTPTAKPTAKDEETSTAVEELKEKVESKVTELKNENNRTKAGFVTEVNDDTIKISTDTGSTTVEMDPDVTTFYQISGTKTSEIKVDDLEKGDYVLVSGPEIGSSITANSIYKDAHYIAASGKIIEVNADSFYVKVTTLEKDTYTVDIETNTTSQIMDIKTFELSNVGFSKLKEGDNIHFVAAKDTEGDQARVSASKIIIIPQEYFIK